MVNRMTSGLHRKEAERIQCKLQEFLTSQEAQETTMQLIDLTLDVDEEIDRILEDPLLRRLYQYDGRFFTSRGTGQFHTAFDGLHLLKSLTGSMIETFFRGRKKHSAIRWLLGELDKHRWVAKRRRLNWEESQTLGLLTKEVIEELVDLRAHTTQCRVDPAPLSPEELAFFNPYEDQMGITTRP